MSEPDPLPFGDEATQLAALDLGSNSFHLVVAVERNGGLQIVDKLKEMVRLADGIGEDHDLDRDAADRALACLQRYGQRLRRLRPENVRVVGTNTLRIASEARDFLKRAETALGHRIEIISGREEARLIYLGVAHALEDDHDRRLVIDIGGGSTELIVGRHFEPELLESLHMGCVGLTRSHFADGKLTSGRFKRAYQHALQELEPVRNLFRTAGWETAIGASGTILAADAILRQHDGGTAGITRDGIHQLRDLVLQASSCQTLKLPGLASERAPVFAAGVAILAALMDGLDISTLQPSQGALREGVLYDLIGRNHQHDVRETAVADLTERFHINLLHGERVQRLALELLAHVADPWALQGDENRRLLGWAARLHEIGMDVSHSQYHKHGAYLLQNLDMAGFSRSDQGKLAALVRIHRRKWPKDDLPAALNGDQTLVRLAVLLRLGVLLRRGRSDDALPAIRATADEAQIELHIPALWLEQHPLTQLDLEQESLYLRAAGIQLTVAPENTG